MRVNPLSFVIPRLREPALPHPRTKVGVFSAVSTEQDKFEIRFGVTYKPRPPNRIAVIPPKQDIEKVKTWPAEQKWEFIEDTLRSPWHAGGDFGEHWHTQGEYRPEDLTDVLESFSGEELKQLAATGADINLKYKNTSPLVFLAVYPGRTKLLKMLLEAGADPNIPASNGNTAAIMAVHWGAAEALQLLINAGANLETRGLEGMTAAGLAALNKKPQCLKVLIESGADFDIKKDAGYSIARYAPLMVLKYKIKRLCGWKPASKVQASEALKTELPQTRTDKPQPENGIALSWTHLDEIPFADVEKWGPDERWAFLEAALYFTNTWQMREGAYKGYHGHLDSPDRIFERVLETFSREEVKKLAATGPYNRQWQILLRDTLLGKPKLLAMLLKAGADPNIVGPDGWTPVMKAAYLGKDEAVQLLINAGANIERKGLKGMMAAGLAALKKPHLFGLKPASEVQASEVCQSTPKVLKTEPSQISTASISRSKQIEVLLTVNKSGVSGFDVLQRIHGMRSKQWLRSTVSQQQVLVSGSESFRQEGADVLKALEEAGYLVRHGEAEKNPRYSLTAAAEELVSFPSIDALKKAGKVTPADLKTFLQGQIDWFSQQQVVYEKLLALKRQAHEKAQTQTETLRGQGASVLLSNAESLLKVHDIQVQLAADDLEKVRKVVESNVATLSYTQSLLDLDEDNRMLLGMTEAPEKLVQELITRLHTVIKGIQEDFHTNWALLDPEGRLAEIAVRRRAQARVVENALKAVGESSAATQTEQPIAAHVVAARAIPAKVMAQSS